MYNPLISVIIPVYNSEKYLKECLDSVVNQTYNNLEIIIINDGSTDNSLQIIKSYKDSRIKLTNKDNGGVSSARNEGLKQATGEYVMFVDSDDYLTNNNVIAELIYNIDNSDLIKYGHIVKKNNSLIKDDLINELKEVYCSGESFLLDILNKKKDYGWYLWQYLFKRSLWEEIVFPNREILEDLSTIYKVILNAKTIKVSGINVYTYRINSLSLANNITYNKCIQLLEATKEAVRNTNSLSINNELKTLLKNNFSYGYVSELLLASYLNNNEKKKINRLLIQNKEITNNIIYGKQKLIIKMANIFGIEFVELLFKIRKRIKQNVDNSR